MVKSRKHIKKPVIIDNKFVIDPEWKDPLINESDYDEMEVEEFSYYYNIHLGVPANNKE